VESLRRVYTASNKVEARTMWIVAKKRWGSIYPTLIATIEKDLRSLLAFLDSPREHHKYIRTSNPIERIFLELRRRRYGCAAFADVKACDRALYGVYETINRKWKVGISGSNDALSKPTTKSPVREYIFTHLS